MLKTIRRHWNPRARWNASQNKARPFTPVLAYGLVVFFGLGVAAMAAGFEGPNSAAAEGPTCPYLASACQTTGDCVSDIQNSMAVLVSYNGGCTLGKVGCGNEPSPTGEGTVPCGPAEPADCQ